MRVLVIGAEGQLGNDLCNVFGDTELSTADLDGGGYRLDICDTGAMRELLETLRPDFVLNAAAAHNVPKCEEDPATAFAVNTTAVFHLAQACHAIGARLLHVSTDYVFGQGHTQPIPEDAMPAPLSVYAASKLAGEHLLAAHCPNHIIVRTAAIYGTAECRAKGGKNFVQMMLHLAATRPVVKVVTDEFTTPTYTLPLAKQMRTLLERGEPGLYHVTCEGECSWYDFAKAIFDETGTEANLQPTTSAEFQSPVKRPSYSVLENKRAKALGMGDMPHWRDGLRAYLAALEKETQAARASKR